MATSGSLRILLTGPNTSWVGPAGLRFHAASDCCTEVLLGFVIFLLKQFNGLTELLVKFDDDTDFETLF